MVASLTEVRALDGEVGLFSRTHGSALFVRGNTQALAITTLAAPGAEQLIETMETNAKRRFMLHYNFPPFSVGEVGTFRGPGRREIGHGNLARKSLERLIPTKEEFPYTIRVVSEIMSSNGSSSHGNGLRLVTLRSWTPACRSRNRPRASRWVS